jgi:DNA polymerase-3 subunit epsilon
MTRADLLGKPKFAEIMDEMLEFFGDEPLVAHNAAFDFGFLNAELARAGRPSLPLGRMVCTLTLAKTRFPGLPNSLDALCRRFGIDLSERTTHNALLDCRLLADVYIELTGGRQRGLSLEAEETGPRMPAIVYAAAAGRQPRPITPSADELAAHEGFIKRLKEPVWAV